MDVDLDKLTRSDLEALRRLAVEHGNTDLLLKFEDYDKKKGVVERILSFGDNFVFDTVSRLVNFWSPFPGKKFKIYQGIYEAALSRNVKKLQSQDLNKIRQIECPIAYKKTREAEYLQLQDRLIKLLLELKSV